MTGGVAVIDDGMTMRVNFCIIRGKKFAGKKISHVNETGFMW